MPAHTIRVLCESKDTSFSIVDDVTEEPLFWWRGNDLKIELALTSYDQFLVASDVGVIAVVVKNIDAAADDSPLMLKTLGAGDCDLSFTGQEWAQESGQLCVAEWTKEEAALDAGRYVIVVSHDDPSGNRNTFLHSLITVNEDQHDSLSLSAPPIPPSNYYTQSEILSLFGSISSARDSQESAINAASLAISASNQAQASENNASNAANSAQNIFKNIQAQVASISGGTAPPDYSSDFISNAPSFPNSSGSPEFLRVYGEVEPNEDRNGLYYREDGVYSWTKVPGDLTGRVTNVESGKQDRGLIGKSTDDLVEVLSARGKVARKVLSNGDHVFKVSPDSEIPVKAIKDNIINSISPDIGGIYAVDSSFRAIRLDDPLGSMTVRSHQNISWSQWVWPLFVEVPMWDAHLATPVTAGVRATSNTAKVWGGVAGLESSLQESWSGQKIIEIEYPGSSNQSHWTVDDHNAACMLIDLRPSASAPLRVIQNDHSGPQGTRYVDSPSGQMKDAGSVTSWSDSRSDSTYGMVARNPSNPDQIFYIYRTGNFMSAVWVLLYTDDNGATWNDVELFGVGGGSEYVLAKQARDGSGLHILSHWHPNQGGDQGVRYLHLSWDGALSDPVNGVHIADVKSEDHNYEIFDNSNSSLEVFSNTSGYRTRLFDFTETTEGGLEIVLAHFENGVSQDFSDSETEYRHIHLDATSGVVTQSSSLGDAGWPQEENVGSNQYFCGATVVGEYDVIIARWNPHTLESHQMIPAQGVGELERLKSDDGGITWRREWLLKSRDKKFMRPLLSSSFWLNDSGEQVYLPGSEVHFLYGTYRGFGTWESEMKTIKIKTVNN